MRCTELVEVKLSWLNHVTIKKQECLHVKTVIEIQEIEHKNEWRYFLFYDYTTATNNLVRNLLKAKYSATHRTWHLPLTEESKTTLRNFVKQNPFILLKKKHVEKDKNNSIEIKPLPNESKKHNTSNVTKFIN